MTFEEFKEDYIGIDRESLLKLLYYSEQRFKDTISLEESLQETQVKESVQEASTEDEEYACSKKLLETVEIPNIERHLRRLNKF